MSVHVAQRKTSGSGALSCVFLMLLLEMRERHVGLGLVRRFLIGNSFASVAQLLLPRGIGLTMAGGSTVVELRRAQQ